MPLLIGMAITAAVPRHPDAAAAVPAAAAADQARGGDDQPLSLARHGAADRVLHPAPCRRHREPGAANEQIARLLSGGIAANALNLTSMVFFAVAMAIYDLPLAAIGVGMSLLNVLALRLIGERREDLSRSLSMERGKLIGATVERRRTIETIKASGLEDEAFGQWAGIQAKALNAEQDLACRRSMLDMIPTLISGLTMAAILGLGGLRVIEGSLTLGSLVAFQSLMASFSEPVNDWSIRPAAFRPSRARSSASKTSTIIRSESGARAAASLPAEA